MKKYYLAVDIGASSGRHMLAHMEDGCLQLEEVYRFQNGMQEMDGALCWDFDRLFSEIKKGMIRCREVGKIPVSMAVDTWGVDFVLLDKKDRVLGQCVGYRDKRTKGMDKKVESVIPQERLYERTGIQKQVYNTIYQLQSVKEEHPEYLKAAESLLMTPDYFHFLLTGVKKMEYTIATTGQLVNVETKDWDFELIDLLGFPKKIFRSVSMPGTYAGNLSDDVKQEVGFDCKVVLPASHDTGSAVLAVPAKGEDVLYISSGTWSLMGVERKEPDCSMRSMKSCFTNEGGYDYRYRYLRNIMGLWMIQSVKKELAPDLSYEKICEAAAGEEIRSIVDCNDDSFLAPESMAKAVQDFCENTKQQIPKTLAEIAAVIYHSLAKCYADTLGFMEEITGKHYDTVYVVGGGSSADYLNKLTAGYTGRKVSAGPVEATAIGNVAVQMISDGVFEDLSEMRRCIRESFDIKLYVPDKIRD
ncbi:MAG: rhamnulokinase [Dorea sp.]|nr:rhamnulokinase [Dorea sp.]